MNTAYQELMDTAYQEMMDTVYQEMMDTVFKETHWLYQLIDLYMYVK